MWLGGRNFLAFGVTGFAALHLQPQPQVFQALSVGSRPPLPPAPPYGTPNQNLVPVAQSPQTVHLNLTLAAQPAFAAILHVNSTIVGSNNGSVSSTPNSTAAVGARNPAVHIQTQGTSSTPSQVPAAAGPISFTLTTVPKYVTSAVDALQQTPQLSTPPPAKETAPANTPAPALDHELQKAAAENAPAPQSVPSSAPSIPASSTPQYVLPANSGAVARIVSTVSQLAVSAVYPAPIFSFSA
jgi:hypothetical protein